METNRICICLVNQDLICCNIVADILKSCTYEVLNVGRPLETLHNISVRKDEISLVLTNLHRIQAQGPNDMLNHIQNTLKLPTFLMSPDSEKIELKCQENSFAAYLLASLDSSSFYSVWELAMVNATRQGLPKATESAGTRDPGPSSSKNLVIGNESVGEKRERAEVLRVAFGVGDDEQSSEKKARVIWTPELHEKFVQAVNLILPERPVPKKIAQLINLPWLKRENVASHLQKYRIFLRKAKERVIAVSGGSIPKDPRVLRLNSNGGGMAYFHQHILGLSSIAARSIPPSSINARGPSLLLNASTSRVLPSNNQGSLQQLCNHQNLASKNGNYSSLADSKGNDHTGLQQMQLNLHPGNLEMNSGFRAKCIYGDQERSMLLGDPGSKNMNDSTVTDSSVGSFLGFRLTNDGKFIEFGQPSAPGSIGRELSISEISGSENQSLNHLLPATATNQTQVPPIASMQEHASSQDNDSAIKLFLDFISRLAKSLTDTTPVNPCTAIQHSDTTVNEEALHELSMPVNNILPPQQQAFLPQFEFGTPSSWDLSAQSAPLPTSGEQQLSSLLSDIPRHDHLDQHHAAIQNGIIDDQLQLPAPQPSADYIVAHFSTMPASQQESLTVSSAEIPGHDASIQGPPAPFQSFLNQESSVSEQPNYPLRDENFSGFLNGAASPTAIWDDGFDETFFNPDNINPFYSN